MIQGRALKHNPSFHALPNDTNSAAVRPLFPSYQSSLKEPKKALLTLLCPQGTKQEGLILAAILSAVNYVALLAENLITIDLSQKFLRR